MIAILCYLIIATLYYIIVDCDYPLVLNLPPSYITYAMTIEMCTLKYNVMVVMYYPQSCHCIQMFHTNFYLRIEEFKEEPLWNVQVSDSEDSLVEAIQTFVSDIFYSLLYNYY